MKTRQKSKSKATKNRLASVKRKTRETAIQAKILIDGAGKSKIKTGVGFLDHMLELFTKHGFFDIELSAKGDLHVDRHHTNEDVAITLGQAFAKALGTKKGIRRYGFFYLPMDETLARVCLDISARPSLFFRVASKINERGELYKMEDAEHFLQSFSAHAGLNMHVDVLAGKQHHHVIEAIFKAFARALDMATQLDAREHSIPSTKGIL